MRQLEAEEAAARSNREDPRRDRFVFYALDESAGLASDAWDVAMRLRRDAEQPQRKSKARRASAVPRERRAEPPAPAIAVMEPEVMSEATVPLEWQEPEPTQVYDIEGEPEPEPEPHLEPEPVRRRRRFGLVRLWGVFVVLVGLAFIAAVFIVAFKFRDYTHMGTLAWGTGVAAGLVAVAVGTALVVRRRS